MHQAQPAAREQDRRERGAHALQFRVGLHVCGDGRVTFVHCVVELLEQITARLVVVQMGQRRDHQLGGHLARGVTHAVGQCQQPRTRVHRVLVVRAHQSAVAARRIP